MNINENRSDIKPINHDETAVKETSNLSPQERFRLLREWATDHDSDTLLLSEDEINRESIYGERG